MTETLTDGDYTLEIADDVEDLFGNSLDGDSDGDDGGDFVRQFRIATPGAKGDEFQVNTFTAGNQRTDIAPSRRIGVDADGNFVIAWMSFAQDGDGFGIYARRYDATGMALDDEFVVNNTTAGEQRFPSVVMAPDGRFVVAWLSDQNGDPDIYARRYDAMGNPDGDEFMVNTTTANIQLQPTVAIDDAGRFVIVWETTNSDFTQANIFFQRFDADGTPAGGETQANIFNAGRQDNPEVAMGPGGDFVIAWRSPGQDGSGEGIYARRYDADGRSRGGEFRVNTTTGGDQQHPSLAIDDDGEFVVTWGSQGQDGSGLGVYAQRYNAAGQTVGPEFRVNQFTTGDQMIPRVTSDADGDLVFIWTSDGQDGDDTGIYARRYDALGQAQGDEFRVNTTTVNEQNFAMAGATANGDFVIAWSSFGQDGDGWGVFAQRYGVNLPPRADAGGPYFISEGDSLQLDASASLDPDSGGPLTFAWDLDNDGVFDDAVGETPLVNWAMLTSVGIADDGVFPVAVEVFDSGGRRATAATTVTVNNTGPSPLFLDPLEAIVEGGEAVIGGSFTDPGTLDEHTLRVDWGDGTVQFIVLPVGDRAFAAMHTYADDDPSGTPADDYTISIELSDDDGGMIAGQRVVSVSNAPPEDLRVSLSEDEIDEGDMVTLSGSFTDPGLLDTHTVDIDWGDGTINTFPLPAGQRAFGLAHTYVDDNPTGTSSDIYTIIVNVRDDDGGQDIAGELVTVNNAAPDATIQGVPADGQVQSLISLTPDVNDPGVQDTFTYDWQLRFQGNLVATAQSVDFAFTPLDEGLYEVTLNVTDDDGGVGMDSVMIDIGPCQTPGDANGDCVVDIDDLNDVRNNFGRTGLGAVDLSFNSPVSGTILDNAGLGTGFTHRLPGTGGALPALDPNLDLMPGGNGVLLVTSTFAHLANPASTPLVEAPGVLVTGVQSSDFEVSASFINVDVPNGSDQLMIFVGAAGDRVIRAGFHDPSTYAIAVNDGGVDTVVFTTGAGAFTPGDDVTLTFARTDGQYMLSWQNLTNPAASGDSGAIATALLDGQSDLVMGIVHSSPSGVATQTATVDSFNIDLLGPVPGDTNGDRVVDLDDLNAVRNNFGAGVPGLRASGDPTIPAMLDADLFDDAAPRRLQSLRPAFSHTVNVSAAAPIADGPANAARTALFSAFDNLPRRISARYLDLSSERTKAETTFDISLDSAIEELLEEDMRYDRPHG